MAGMLDGNGSSCQATATEAKSEGGLGEKNCRRASSETNTCCSRSIDADEDQACVNVATECDAKEAAVSEHVREEDSAGSICKSHVQESNEGLSKVLKMATKPELQTKHQVIDESEAVSDISGSESEPSSMSNEWMLTDDQIRRNTMCTIKSATSDHGSIQSLRESVDRVLMSSQDSFGRGDIRGRTRSDSRDCMQKNFSPAVAQMLYDQNYYRSADWLRFVPRKSSNDDISSREEGSSSGLGSYSNVTPDRFYRMFDNTKIRVGFHSLGEGRTVVRQQENAETVLAPSSGTQIENFRLMHPDLVIDKTIDEEVVVEREGTLETDVRTEFGIGGMSDRPPPTQEIYCDPTSDSCGIAFEDSEYLHNQETQITNEVSFDDSNMQSFHSALRKGAIVRPSSHEASSQNHVNFHNLPEHLREEEMHKASWDSKYETYACRVDQTQDDRAVEIPVFSMARPHMRAFHFAWISFFSVFLAWFSIAPLLSEIQASLDLSKKQIWTTSIFSVAGGLVSRCIMGVLCDIYGARLMTAAVLFTTGLPTCFTGLVNTSIGLSVLRLVIGVGGSAFVTCQYWTSTMFTREVAGTVSHSAPRYI